MSSIIRKAAAEISLSACYASFFALAFGVEVSGCGSSDTAAPSAGGSAATSGGSNAGAGGASTATGGGNAGGSAGEAGSPACDPTYKCSAVIGQSGDPAQLCPGSAAETAFETLNTCVCSLACASKCKDSACAQTLPSTSCLTCIMDTAAGCGTEAAACSAN
jgi:hypothetical protein